MEIYNYSIVTRPRGVQRLEGQLGGVDGPLWKTSCIKQVKGDYVITAGNRLYRLMCRNTKQNATPKSYFDDDQSITSNFLSEEPEEETMERLDESEPVGFIPSPRNRDQTYQTSPRKDVTVDGAFERSRGVRAADASSVRDLTRRYTRAKESHRKLAMEFKKSEQILQELKLALDSQIQDATPTGMTSHSDSHHQQMLIDYPPSDATFDGDAEGQSGFLQKPVPHQSRSRSPRVVFSSRSAIRVSHKKKSTQTLIRPKNKSKELMDSYCSPIPEDAASEVQRGKNSSGKPSSHSVTRVARKFTSLRTLVCPKNTSGEVTDSYCSPTQEEVVSAIHHGQTQGSPRTPPSASERPRRINSVSRTRKETASPAQLNTNTPLKLAGKKTRPRNEELADITDQVNNSYSYDISDSHIPSTPDPKKSMLPRVVLSTHSEVPEKIPSHVKRRQTFEDNMEEEEPFSNDELRKKRKDSHGFAKSPSRLSNQQKGKAGGSTLNSRRE